MLYISIASNESLPEKCQAGSKDNLRLRLSIIWKTMPLTHGYSTVNHYVVSIVYDPVNDCVRDRTVIVRVRINSLVPAFRMVLSAENH